MLGRLSLRVKLVGAFFVTALLIGLISFFSLKTISDTRITLNDIVNNDLARISALQDMQIGVLRTDSQMREYQQNPNKATEDLLLQAVGALDSKETAYKQYDSNSGNSTLEANAAAVSAAKQQVSSLALDIVLLNQQAAPTADLALKAAEFKTASAELDEALSIAIKQEIDSTNTASIAVDAQIAQSYAATTVVTTLTAAFALLIGLLMSVGIGRNLKKLQEGSQHLANGDFSKEIVIKTKDELGQLARSFNEMSASLRGPYRRLALEKQRDETLLESMTEGMIALDEQGRIVLINNVAINLFELTQSDIAGSAFEQIAPLLDENQKPLDPNKTITAITLQAGLAINNTYSRLNKANAKTLINIAASPINLEGHIAGAILVLRDVTKEKEVDRMKTEFISLASHQLRTPLSAIKWFSEMLLAGDAGELKPEQADFAKNIADSTDRMVDLVNSLLNISRIESGRIIVDPKPTDLSELIGGIVNDLKAKTEERQQALVISVHPDIPKINLDPRLIGQVYMNLLTNAIKYTPKKGEISVFVSRKGDDIVSQVTDNGYGIPQAQQGRVFQKFFRAENVAKVETDGTGLGLYLIKAIVESSGGRIWFESKEGKGTTFWFTLPMSGMKPKAGEVTLDA